MEQSLFLIILSIVISFAIAPFVINVLYKKRVVRQIDNDFATILPEARKKHGTPIMGGLIFIVSYCVLLLVLYITSRRLYWDTIFFVTGAFLVTAIWGGIDDLLVIFGKARKVMPLKKHIRIAKIHKYKWKRVLYWLGTPISAYKNLWYALGSYPGNGLHAGEKVLIQLILFSGVSFWIYSVMGVDSIWYPGGSLYLGWLIVPLFTFLLGFFANGVNITDGMDGLAAGVTLPAVLAASVLAVSLGNEEVLVMSSILAGGLITYLYFNIKPARVQMGDVGALALGVIIFLFYALLDRVFILPIVMSVVVLEILSSVLQGFYRRIAGRRLFKMAPLHYHFEVIGWSEEKIVMRFWLWSAIAVIVGLWVAFL